MTLIYLSVAWMIGIYVASQIAIPPVWWGAFTLFPASVLWLWKDERRVRLSAWCVLFLCLGAGRYAVAVPRFDAHSVASYNDKGWVTLTGVVVAEPDVRDTYTNVKVRTETLSTGDIDPINANGLVLVRVPRYPEIAYGDRLQVRGQLETPPVFETFSYRDYLARKGIYSLVRWARITVLEQGQGSPLLAALLSFKHHTQRVIASVLPEPMAALLTGILTGTESGLPAGLVADFGATGTSHIIAISGFNIALVSGVVTSLSVRLVGRRCAAWFSTSAIVVYTLFVGASGAVVRAALMGCVAVWGDHFGRQNSAPNALFATALLMTIWNPHTLWDLGFALSFAATLGLIVLADPFQQRFEGALAHLLPANWVEPAAKWLNEALVLTTCAQLTTLPIIIYSFRTLSLVTLLSNVLVLPVQPQVMLWGALATIGGLIWLPLGRFLGWVTWLFLAYTIWAVEWTADLPHAALTLDGVSTTLVWGWYGVLAAGAWLMAQSRDSRADLWRSVTHRLPTKLLVGGLLIVAVLAWTAVLSLPDGKLHVHFLDVGGSDASLIETPDGKQILINGGPSPAAIVAHLGRRMPFWDHTLDLVVLTDLGEERVMGLISVLERYAVENVLQNPQECDSTACARWQELLSEKSVIAQQAAAGTQVDLGQGAILTVLHPVAPLSAGSESAAGDHPLVLRLDYGQSCFLFAGSSDAKAEAALLARGEDLRCDVLQVASRDAAGVSFLEQVRPAVAVIACDQNRRTTCPDEALLARLERFEVQVVRTDEVGSIEIASDGERYEVRVGR